MWLSRPLLIRTLLYPAAELDFAKNIPKEYVEKAKRTVPRKVYTNRFGAPDVIRWFLPPDDYVPGYARPWESGEFSKNTDRAARYHQKLLSNKFFIKRYNKFKRMDDSEWTIFPGDLVEVMVGADKGKQGIVIQVLRDTNSVYVEGLHRILKADLENAKKLGLAETLRWVEQPLDASKKQVKLVDPNTNEACDAKWILNGAKTEYLRISVQTGYEIPIPSQAYSTYEYLKPEAYVEVENKDTKAEDVLQRTYVPKLCSFEEEIMEDMGIQEDRVPKPTYWY
uniref:Large ribosomal subunit protein uL24m n=1 Tax=Syphacia muris TaxID=451379 RepID=A0A0N5AQP3_9BILA